MPSFIEVHQKGKKRLINLDWVEEIHDSEDGHATIYFSFSCPDAYEQDCMKVDESYYKILEMIWR